MCRNRRIESVQTNGPDYLYDISQVATIVQRYQELKSAVEITSRKQERVGGNGQGNGKEELLCALIDIDRAGKLLSPRQTIIIGLLKQGYQYEDICRLLGVSITTVKFHTQQGIVRMTTYLNTHHI